ncbi:MAG: hypothetical protein HON90_07315 [Halobacteriovoraceae bacterium]|nr:hypothetical protein [Halobacteriovoraceae bacterium]
MDTSWKIEVEAKAKDNEHLVKLFGVLNEDSTFAVIENEQVRKLVFDFEQVTGINSCGIREWTNFLKCLDAEIELVYINCSVKVIEQVNMIVDFTKRGAKIETFYAPYFCDSCDKEVETLLSSDKVVGGNAPALNCSSCGSEMEFDAVETQYFEFLK